MKGMLINYSSPVKALVTCSGVSLAKKNHTHITPPDTNPDSSGWPESRAEGTTTVISGELKHHIKLKLFFWGNPSSFFYGFQAVWTN